MILLTGATGTVGSVLARKLRARGVAVRALVRSPDRTAELVGLGVELAVGDFGRRESLTRALQGVDAAFLLGPADADQVAHETAFIDAAAEARVRLLVAHSAVGADPEARGLSGRHGRVEQHLARSGVPHIVVRPTQYMDILLHWVPPIARTGALVMPLVDPEARVNQIDVDDIADVEANLLLGGGKVGATYTPTGPELLTYGEIALRISRGLGVAIPLIVASPDEYRRGQLRAGARPGDVEKWIDYFSTLRRGHTALAITTEDVLSITGHPPTPHEVFARRHSDELRPLRPADEQQPSL